MTLLATFIVLAAAILLSLQVLRLHDMNRMQSAWRTLARLADQSPTRFDPAMIADLPDPARRYFLFTISPGARLNSVAEIEMSGELSLGTREKPNRMIMHARQILAGPRGFIWSLQARSCTIRITGSDGYANGSAWTRFWLLNLVPVVRAGNTADFARSAAGRAIAEAVFWTPANLLPQLGITWEAVDDGTARVHVSHEGHVHVIDVTVGSDGRPESVLLQRWSRENADREWRLQPFGGTVKNFIEVDGYRLPASIDGGNWFGTDAYFPFYHVTVGSLRFV